MPAYIIAAFLFGMMVLAFLAIVVETWWVVAGVGTAHMVGSIALMVLVIRALEREERQEDPAD